MGLILAIDAGNSTVKFGLFDGSELVESWAEPTAQVIQDARTALARVSTTIEGAAGASVVREATEALANAVREMLGQELHLLGEDLASPIEIACDTPAKVGADRLANAIAAREILGCPAVAVDFGTAITLDVVDANGAFVGGAIAPGVGSGAQGLFSAADLLEPMELQQPTRAIGRNTQEALEAGVLMGAAGAVDGLIRRIWGELGGQCPTIATGGGAQKVMTFCETVRRVDEFLTLRGVAVAFEKACR